MTLFFKLTHIPTAIYPGCYNDNNWVSNIIFFVFCPEIVEQYVLVLKLFLINL